MFLIVHILQVGKLITHVRFLENTFDVSGVVVRYPWQFVCVFRYSDDISQQTNLTAF